MYPDTREEKSNKRAGTHASLVEAVESHYASEFASLVNMHNNVAYMLSTIIEIKDKYSLEEILKYCLLIRESGDTLPPIIEALPKDESWLFSQYTPADVELNQLESPAHYYAVAARHYLNYLYNEAFYLSMRLNNDLMDMGNEARELVSDALKHIASPLYCALVATTKCTNLPVVTFENVVSMYDVFGLILDAIKTTNVSLLEEIACHFSTLVESMNAKEEVTSPTEDKA